MLGDGPELGWIRQKVMKRRMMKKMMLMKKVGMKKKLMKNRVMRKKKKLVKKRMKRKKKKLMKKRVRRRKKMMKRRVKIEDHRPIPTYKGGNKIKIPVIQWYLSKKIEEWVALGDERLLDKGQFLASTYKNKNFKRVFYWNLWQDLDNLRAEATAVSTVATYLERAYL